MFWFRLGSWLVHELRGAGSWRGFEPHSRTEAQPQGHGEEAGMRCAHPLKFRFLRHQKKSDAELNFRDQMRLLRGKPTNVAFLKYRLSSALLDFEGGIWRGLVPAAGLLRGPEASRGARGLQILRLRRERTCRRLAFAIGGKCF
jgi:hypothetical protein